MVHMGVAMLLSYLPDVLCIVPIYGLEVDMPYQTRGCAETLPTSILLVISRDRLEQADSRIYTASPRHRFHHNDHRLHHMLWTLLGTRRKVEKKPYFMMFVYPGGITGTIWSSFLGHKDHRDRHNFTVSSQSIIRLDLRVPKTTRCNLKHSAYNQTNYTKKYEILSASVMHRASYLQQQPLRYSYLILQLSHSICTRWALGWKSKW